MEPSREMDFQQAAQYLISNKKYLPESVISSLAQTFGKEKTKKSDSTRQRAKEGRRQLQLFTKDMILHTAKNLGTTEDPATFWNLTNLRVFSNVVSCLYYRSRSLAQQDTIFRLFFTTAIHLVTKKVCERLGTRLITAGVMSHLVRWILGPAPDQNDADTVADDIRADSHAGAVYERYANELGGYGAYFLIPIMPLSMFENVFNMKDDTPFAITQFKNMGIPQIAKESGLHDRGNYFMSYIENLFPINDVPAVKRKSSLKTSRSTLIPLSSIMNDTETPQSEISIFSTLQQQRSKKHNIPPQTNCKATNTPASNNNAVTNNGRCLSSATLQIKSSWGSNYANSPLSWEIDFMILQWDQDYEG